MKILSLLILSLIAFSCRSIQYVPVETVKTETEYVDRWRRDSVHVRDSVFVLVKGDTVYIDKYKTIYKDRIFRDTTYIERIDTTSIPYPVEKQLTRWQSVKMEAGGFALGGMAIILLLLIIKFSRKFI